MNNNKPVVLIVEDEAIFRVVFTGVLRGNEYTVHEAVDGEQGLEMVKSKKPDIILLDLVLPKMNGFDVLKAIKTDKDIKHIPVIVLSVLGEEDKMQMAFSLGANDYMIKGDNSPKAIIDKIEALLHL